MPEPQSVIQTENCMTFGMQVRRDLNCFPGHFPSRFVLPGVVILDWVMDLAREKMGLRASAPVQMEAVKFRHPIEPNRDILLEIRYLVEKDKIVYRLYSDDTEFSSGRVLVEKVSESNSYD
jgi:3-hydroxymyristoyl/3-hydroxydecanoyl-(acyl carrier protein) dehydratase